MIRIYCVSVSWLQSIVAAGWMCLAPCLSSRRATLDGAVIMLQAAHTLYDTVPWPPPPSPCPLHAEHKEHSWLILLSGPVHNDSAACIWLVVCALCHWGTDDWKKWRKGKKQWRLIFNFYVYVLLRLWLRGPRRVREKLIIPRDCGGIHLTLSIVWQ